MQHTLKLKSMLEDSHVEINRMKENVEEMQIQKSRSMTGFDVNGKMRSFFHLFNYFHFVELFDRLTESGH